MKFGTSQTTASLDDLMLPCLNKEFLGVECPGCGIQRAVALLLDGQFAAAFVMYPAVYTMILLFGFLVADQFVTIRYANKISITLMVLTVILILVNFILKFI